MLGSSWGKGLSPGAPQRVVGAAVAHALYSAFRAFSTIGPNRRLEQHSGGRAGDDAGPCTVGLRVYRQECLFTLAAASIVAG